MSCARFQNTKQETNMSEEAMDQIDHGLKLELDDDTSSMHTESEDLNSPQVETNTENELSEYMIKIHSFCRRGSLIRLPAFFLLFKLLGNRG